MAFIRAKRVNGSLYRYQVENYRDKDTGKVRQRTGKHGSVWERIAVASDSNESETMGRSGPQLSEALGEVASNTDFVVASATGVNEVNETRSPQSRLLLALPLIIARL